MITGFILTVLLVIGVALTVFRKKKQIWMKRAKIGNDDNESDFHKHFVPKTTNLSQIMKSQNDHLYDSQGSREDGSKEDGYPEWLSKRQEMLFSSCNLERGQKLGSGHYGSVYKGKLSQGNAV